MNITQVFREFLAMMKLTITLPKADMIFSNNAKGSKLEDKVWNALCRIKKFGCIKEFFYCEGTKKNNNGQHNGGVKRGDFIARCPNNFVIVLDYKNCAPDEVNELNDQLFLDA